MNYKAKVGVQERKSLGEKRGKDKKTERKRHSPFESLKYSDWSIHLLRTYFVIVKKNFETRKTRLQWKLIAMVQNVD